MCPRRKLADTFTYGLPVVVDEIQRGLLLRSRFFLPEFGETERSILSAFVTSLKPHIKTYIWMGTGMQYSTIRDLLTSAAEKLSATWVCEDYNGFEPMNKEQIEQFANLVLTSMEPGTDWAEIVEVICDEEFCHGRARSVCRQLG
jgi:hypothetical protein